VAGIVFALSISHGDDDEDEVRNPEIHETLDVPDPDLRDRMRDARHQCLQLDPEWGPVLEYPMFHNSSFGE
jgi:hypothetical protein